MTVLTPIEKKLRGLFLKNPAPRNEPRFRRYGIYDAHTGELVKKYKTRLAALAAKGSYPDPHSLRVRGVPNKKKKAKK